jgi:hypothetical protein
MDSVEDMHVSAEREDALRRAPGRPVILIRPVPVKARFAAGHVIAYTITHVLVETKTDGRYNVRWEISWQVKRV